MFVDFLFPVLVWLTAVSSYGVGELAAVPPAADEVTTMAVEQEGRELPEGDREKAKGKKDEARAALREKMQQLAAAILEHEIRMAKLKTLAEVYDARGNDARVAEVVELERRENERFAARVLVFRADLPKEVLAHVDRTLRDSGGSSKAAATKSKQTGAKRRDKKANSAVSKTGAGAARPVPASSRGRSAGKGQARPRGKSGAKSTGGSKAAATKKAQAPRSKKGRAAGRTLSQDRIREVLSRAGRSRFLLGTRRPSLGKRDR